MSMCSFFSIQIIGELVIYYLLMVVTPVSIVSGSIIDYLQMLKEKWESCKDPEKDAVKKMWWSVFLELSIYKEILVIMIH